MAMQPQRRWYAEPWVWLLIALPGMAVIGGMITLYLAVSTSDGLVVDDYYRRGKAINMDLARDAAAAAYGVRASLLLDAALKVMHVELTPVRGAWPDTLQLAVMHPTRAGADQHIVLRHSGSGQYSGRLDELADGHWYLQLSADDWRLSGTLRVPQEGPLLLVPLE